MSRLSKHLNELNSDSLGMRDISRRAKELGYTLSPSSASNYLAGKHPEFPSKAKLQAFAAVFNVPFEELEAIAADTGREPFEPHRDADLLTAQQRAAVNEVIRLMAEGNKAGSNDSPPHPQEQGASSEEDQAEKTPDLTRLSYDLAAYKAPRARDGEE